MGTQDVDDHESSTAVEKEDHPEVPEGVLRGIEDIADGETASKDDLESVLKY
jgi:hypothetical protein